MSTLKILLIINYSISFLAVLSMIFYQKKKFERIAAWIITLTFLPFLGLSLYTLIGGGLGYTSKRMIKKRMFYNEKYNAHLKRQTQEIIAKENSQAYPKNKKEIVLLNLKNSDSVLSNNNEIEYFFSGTEMADSLYESIKQAKSSIHLEFYIFANDKIGKKFKELLISKAKEGVEVRLVYDAIGSFKTYKRHFKKLKKAGGEVFEFFPPMLGIKHLNWRANYRNHRKICIIDGNIGYIGGINLRDDHMGLKRRLSPWRDTHMKIKGEAVYSLQNIFLSDWRYSSNDSSQPDKFLNSKYFPKFAELYNCPMQIITSGPDNSKECIKECLIKMIVSAKKRIRIQSPYFIPDDTFMGALKLALLSGVEVEIMVPKMADHLIVFYASYSYLLDIIKLGAKVYVYNGFIHSKTVCTDDDILTLGSCNIDIRSFALNFEANAVIYDIGEIKKHQNMFEIDLANCSEFSDKDYRKFNIFKRCFSSICRLFSAIM